MKPSVYVETTIPSYYHETRRAGGVPAWRESTRRWWDDHRLEYRLFTSRFVIAELEAISSEKRSKCLALLRGVKRLAEPMELETVASYYIEQKAMPSEAAGDAYHLAMATLHRMDFLLTWNCRHLANANKQRHLALLNGRLGLPMPVITTPLTLVAEGLP